MLERNRPPQERKWGLARRPSAEKPIRSCSFRGEQPPLEPYNDPVNRNGPHFTVNVGNNNRGPDSASAPEAAVLRKIWETLENPEGHPAMRKFLETGAKAPKKKKL
jgi:hypothetical protein